MCQLFFDFVKCKWFAVCGRGIYNSCAMTTTRATDTREGEGIRERARQLYCNEGLPSRAVAERLGVKIKTLRAWITRGRWAQSREAAATALEAAARSTASEQGAQLATAAGAWRERVLCDAKALRERAMRLVDAGDADSPQQLRTVVQALSDVDEMARRALGLTDQTDGGGQTLVNIALSGDRLAAPVGRVQDVDAIDVIDAQ